MPCDLLTYSGFFRGRLTDLERRSVRPAGLAHPQGDMRWLHGFLHYGQQLLAQLIQIRLIAQRGGESGGDLGRVILAAIEAAVNDGLETPLDDDEQEDDTQAKDEPLGLLPLHGVIDPHIAVDLYHDRQERCEN